MKLILTLALLTACGSEPKDEASQEVPKQDEKASSKVPEQAPTNTYAMALDELPACSKENAHQLIWLKTESKFYSCEETGWETIAITAPTVTGAKGEKGDPGEPTVENEWYDPITQQRWLLGAVVDGNLINDLCGNSWRLPTVEEAVRASQHGLPKDGVWTSSGVTDGKITVVKKNGVVLQYSLNIDKAWLACVKD